MEKKIQSKFDQIAKTQNCEQTKKESEKTTISLNKVNGENENVFFSCFPRISGNGKRTRYQKQRNKSQRIFCFGSEYNGFLVRKKNSCAIFSVRTKNMEPGIFLAAFSFTFCQFRQWNQENNIKSMMMMTMK